MKKRRQGNPTQIRIPPDMLKTLADRATLQGRSRHAEILMRLRHSLENVESLVEQVTIKTYAVTRPETPAHSPASDKGQQYHPKE